MSGHGAGRKGPRKAASARAGDGNASTGWAAAAPSESDATAAQPPQGGRRAPPAGQWSSAALLGPALVFAAACVLCHGALALAAALRELTAATRLVGAMGRDLAATTLLLRR
jgi:hypothetical protein